MRLLMICAALSALALPAAADDLFPNENPYSCIWRAKASAAPPDARRKNLATCMSHVLQPYDAVQALKASGFDVPFDAAQSIKLAQLRNDYTWAGALLQTLILTGNVPQEVTPSQPHAHH